MQKSLSDDEGIAVAIEDNDNEKIQIAEQLGFEKIDQSEKRLQDKAYVQKLVSYGYNIPDKYL